MTSSPRAASSRSSATKASPTSQRSSTTSRPSESATYTLRPANPRLPRRLPASALERNDNNIKILVDGKLFTEYLSDQATKPYYYPVIGPTGAAITRNHPMKKVAGETQDHNHQRSFWFTHGNVNGYDFWASDPLNPPKTNYGTIKETAKKTLVAGPVLGLIRTTDDWLGPDGKRVCEDERIVTIYNTPMARVLDFDITVKAGDGPVTFGDTKEGMFGLRVASSMDVAGNKKTKTPGKGKITNAEGITDTEAWGKASPWVDYVGTGRRRDRGRRHPQPPRQLPLPDHLARPRLRPVRRQPVWLARLRHEEVGRVHDPRGRVDPVPLPRRLPQGRYRLGQHPQRLPGVCQAARRHGRRRTDLLPGETTPSSGTSCGSTGRSSTHWQSWIRAQRLDVGAERRQQAVVMARAAAQAVALRIEGQAGDEHPVDGFGSDLRAISARLGDAQSTGFEVARRVVDLKEPEPAFGPIDPGADQLLAALERLLEQRPGRDLLGKRRDVKQDRTGPPRNPEGRETGRQERLVVHVAARDRAPECARPSTCAAPVFSAGAPRRTSRLPSPSKASRPVITFEEGEHGPIEKPPPLCR